MEVDVEKVLQALWKTVGKPSAVKLLSKKVSSYILSECNKYDMREDCANQIAKHICDLVQYVSITKLNNEKLDSQLIMSQIKGPIARSLFMGATTVNNSENFIAELLSKIDESDANNIELFFSEIGMTDTSQYISTFKEILVEIKEGKPMNMLTCEDKEENIPYAQVIEDSAPNIRHIPNISDVYEGMSEQEEDLFLQSLPKKFIGENLSNPKEVLDTINVFIKTAGEVEKFTELQKTKREQIRKQAEIRIKEIDSMRDLIMTYLDKTFDERSKIFAKQFECVDKALAAGDMNLLSISLNSITDLAKSSPFKALADIKNVQKQLSSEVSTTFDI